jgi:hypothetical protein
VVIEGLLAADDGGDVLSVDAVEMQMDVLAPLDRRRRLCGGLYAPLRCGGDAMHHAGRFQPRLAHAERHEGHSPGAGEAEQDTSSPRAVAAGVASFTASAAAASTSTAAPMPLPPLPWP